MIRKSVTPKQVINLLNTVLKNDYRTISALFDIRIFCNAKIAKHKTIQVMELRGNYMLGFIGLLNGMFGIDKEGYGGIEIQYEGTKLKKFTLLKNV